ncbi:universal stress protein [Nonomuraea basaltis]|uniref:universal stress protein n=1 Tax=Nonomuraea basaltis TaxID=2495887 RepID=UPI0030B858B2
MRGRIVVGTDGSASSTVAVEWAAADAQGRGCCCGSCMSASSGRMAWTRRSTVPALWRPPLTRPALGAEMSRSALRCCRAT